MTSLIATLAAPGGPDAVDLALGAALGLGLAAAVGFRVFVPFLAASLAVRAGVFVPAGGFSWLGSDLALAVFAAASVLEAAAFLVPYLDHLLDAVAAPAAWLAGVVLMAAALTELAPWLRWVLAVIAGGGTAGLLHGATAGLRLGSTAATGGVANPVAASVETGLSAVMSALAVLVPFAAVILAVYLVVKTGRLARLAGRRLFRR